MFKLAEIYKNTVLKEYKDGIDTLSDLTLDDVIQHNSGNPNINKDKDNFENIKSTIMGLIDYHHLKIYRAVTLDDISDISHELHSGDIGIYWTWDENSAYAYNGNRGDIHLLIYGSVDVDDIDWETTIFQNINSYYTNEKEITLNRRALVTVDKIRNTDTGDDIDMELFSGIDFYA